MNKYNDWINSERGTEKSIPVLLRPPQIPYLLAFVRSRTFASRGWRRARWNI